MKKPALILAIAGVLLGLSPVAGQLYTSCLENRMMEEWLNSGSTTAAAEEDAAADPEEGYSRLREVLASDGGGPEEPPEAAGAREADGAPEKAKLQEPVPGRPASGRPSPAAAGPQKPGADQKILGIIRIDRIKVNAPIVEGVKASNLKAGIGHIPGTAAPGSPGNSALAGHRSYTFGRFFNRLDELKAGDEILIKTKSGEFKYRVYKKLVVKPDDMSILKGSQDENIITLITCTPIYVASHRLIVQAGLEEGASKE